MFSPPKENPSHSVLTRKHSPPSSALSLPMAVLVTQGQAEGVRLVLPVTEIQDKAVGGSLWSLSLVLRMGFMI